MSTNNRSFFMSSMFHQSTLGSGAQAAQGSISSLPQASAFQQAAQDNFNNSFLSISSQQAAGIFHNDAFSTWQRAAQGSGDPLLSSTSLLPAEGILHDDIFLSNTNEPPQALPPFTQNTPQLTFACQTICNHSNINLGGTFSMLKDLEPSPSRDAFIRIRNDCCARPSNKAFIAVVKSLVKSDQPVNFSRFLCSFYIQSRYLRYDAVLLQVIEEVMTAGRVDWMEVVCQKSKPQLCIDEKLMALWTSKRFDLIKSCFSCRYYDLLHLSLETTRAVVTDAVQENASTEILDSILVIVKSTDFLMCVLQLDDKQLDPAVRNLVDYIFLHLNVLELPQEQMKLLSMCSKREVVFGKILLEMALKGIVYPLPKSLEMLGTLDKTYFGVLDLEFLAPIFWNQHSRCMVNFMPRNTRDVVILLIRSGLLHQFGSWLKTQLEECRKACPGCKYCNASTYLVDSQMPDAPAIQQLLFQAGFLPNRLLSQLPDVLPKKNQRSTMGGPPVLQQVGTEENDVDNNNISLMRPQIQRRPPLTSSTSPFPQNMENVVKAFVQQPYSLLILATAKVSTLIGSHCGRKERLRRLPAPKPVQDHVAFSAGDFMLAGEIIEEKTRKVMEDVYDGGDDDVDIDHLYSEEEDKDGDDGDGGGYLHLSVAGEVAVQMEMEEVEEMNTV